MAGSRDYQVEGLVIRNAAVGERDRVVTLFTQNEGKLSFVARGARRPGSSLGPSVQVLTRGRFQCVRRRGLDLITQAATIDSYRKIKDDLWCMSCGLYLAELIDASTVEGASNRTLYDLLIETLNVTNCGACSDMVLRSFELRLLQHLGFCPSLHKCVNCGVVLRPVVNSLSAALGGVICPDCLPSCRDAMPLSVDALKVLRFCLSNQLETSCRVRLSISLAAEVEEHTHRFVRFVVQRELKAQDWLLRLRTEAMLTRDNEAPTIARRSEDE